jgi:hypothetical protein
MGTAVTDSKTPFDDEQLLEWLLAEEDRNEPETPLWRRRLIIAVAVVTAIAMAMVPLYNLIDRGQPTIADNGLEVCGFDYCIVQDGVRAAGLDLVMSRFANTYLDDGGAKQLADTLVAYRGLDPINIEVVERLDGEIEGQYDPTNHTILIERPARAWIVLHEVAHAEVSGHGDDFQTVLIALTEWLDATLAD